MPKLTFLRDYNREPGTYEHLVPQEPGYQFARDLDRDLGQGKGVADLSRYYLYPYFGPTNYDRDSERAAEYAKFIKDRREIFVIGRLCLAG